MSNTTHAEATSPASAPPAPAQPAAGTPTSLPAIPADQFDAIKAKIATVIEDIRPAVQQDGGDLELVDVDPMGIVSVKLHGSCVGCPSSTATLQFGVERYIREEVPQIHRVLCVS